MGLMTVLLSVELSCDVSSVCSLFDENDGRMVVKSGYIHIFLDGRHCQNAVQMLQEGCRHPWTDGHFLVNLIIRRDEVAVLQAEAIKPSKVANTSTTALRKEMVFVDVMKALVN